MVRPIQVVDNPNLGRGDSHVVVCLRSVASFLGGVATALSITWLVASSIVCVAASETKDQQVVIEHADITLTSSDSFSSRLNERWRANFERLENETTRVEHDAGN